MKAILLLVIFTTLGCSVPTKAPTEYGANAVTTTRIKTNLDQARALNQRALTGAARARQILLEDAKLLKQLK